MFYELLYRLVQVRAEVLMSMAGFAANRVDNMTPPQHGARRCEWSFWMGEIS